MRDRATTRQLAREFGISQYRVREILDETGGDPIRLERLAQLAEATVDDLLWEERRLKARIATDWRRLLAIADELEIRRTDEALGLNS